MSVRVTQEGNLVRQSNAVVDWRREQLTSCGFPDALAVALAADCRIDLHALLELVDRGCPPRLAARILAPLDDPPTPC